MKKWFKVLEVNYIEFTYTDKYTYYTHANYVESCSVEDLGTGEIINIDRETTDNRKARVLDMVDTNGLEVGDDFRIEW